MSKSTSLLRVCYFGTYRANYVRNRLLIDGLNANGCEVYECHSTLWQSVADRVEQASGGWRRPSFWLRVIKAYWGLIQAYRRCPEYDVMLIGYPGHFDAVFGRILTKLSRKPMALDILMSLHLIAEERGLTGKSPLTGKLIFYLEKFGLHMPDLLIADTPEYRTYYTEKYRLQSKQFALVPMGIEEKFFFPLPEINPPDDGQLHLIYYGTFIPLHGVETMLKAVALLEAEPPLGFQNVVFHLYGEGQEKEKMMRLSARLGIQQAVFHGWVDKAQLPTMISQAHICFGVFGITKQSLCTIQNKIWECMAMKRPIISGDAVTIREELTHEQHLMLVERANPDALADTVRLLAVNKLLQQTLVNHAYERVQHNTSKKIGRKLKQMLISIQ